ncbi:hypothetical protein DQ04_14511000, partial [Trypanosoma grayi]|uniref:hypothetical protein n=1 Tax=Trypanosoma grayi TaxID=71804 RepID=UPI0004F4A410
RQLRARAHDAAAVKKMVDALRADEDEIVRAHNPFLETNEVRLVPLRLIGVDDDHTVKLLKRRRQRFLGVCDRLSVSKVEARLIERVCDLARKVCVEEDELRAEFGGERPRKLASDGLLYDLNVREDEVVAELDSKVEALLESGSSLQSDEVSELRKKTQVRVSELLEAYLRAECEISGEVSALRCEFPMCVRDVNPSLRTDDLLNVMQRARNEALSVDNIDMQTVCSIEHEQFSRSIYLIGDDRCVLAALETYCKAEQEVRRARAEKRSPRRVQQLLRDKDTAHYKHRLWRARQTRRHLPVMMLVGVNDEEDEVSVSDAEMALPVRTASALVAADPYYLYLQRCKAKEMLEGPSPAVRCLNETMRIRLKQLVADAAQAQHAEGRFESAMQKRYPFLRAPFETLARLGIRIDQDPEFLRMDAERQKLLAPPKELLERFPFLADTIGGVPITQLGLENDPIFMQLAAEREDLILPLKKTMRMVKLKEEEMRERCNTLISAVLNEEAALRERMPYLDFQALPVDVPLRELRLESDAGFAALLAKHAEVCKHPERVGGAEARRLEKAMRDLAGKLAEDAAEAQHRALVEAENLHEKYPYVPEEPVPGVSLVEAGLQQDPAFRALSNELDDLRSDPVANAERIAAVEQAVRARAMELGAAKLHAAEEECCKYPFLAKRVDGVLVGDLRLADDAVFQELVEKRDALAAEPSLNREALVDVERQLRARAHDAAAVKKMVDVLRADEDEDVRAHNPFLETNEVRLVPLRELGLPMDATYAALADERLLLKQDAATNAAAIKATESALCGRAEELALARLVAEEALLAKYPFLAALPGVELLAGDDLEHDPLFARYDELAADPTADAAAVEDAKMALLDEAKTLLAADAEAERAAAAAHKRFRRAAGPSNRLQGVQVADVPEEAVGEITDADTQPPPHPRRVSVVAEKDPYYQELCALRDALLAEGEEMNAPAVRCVEEQMKDRLQQLRTDEQKAARAARRAEQRLLEEYPCLGDVAVAGLPLTALGLTEDEEFVALAEGRLALAQDPAANAESLAATEQSMRARAEQIAAAVAKQEAALRERMPYLDFQALPADVPLRELRLE